MMNNTSDWSDRTLYRQSSEQHLALRSGLGIIAFLSFAGNGFLVMLFIKNRELLKTPYTLFILSLAITDMTTGLALVLTPAYIIGTYNFHIPGGFAGKLFCHIVASYFLVFSLGIVSVYTITCLALERWFAVARPAKYRASFKKRRVQVILSFVWLCSFMFNAPQMFEMTLGRDNSCVWITLTKGKLRKFIAIVEFNGKFFIPLLVTSIAFVNLGFRIRRSPALFKTNHGRAGSHLIRMCMTTAVVLGMCWFPNQLYYLLFKFDLTQMDTPLHHFTVIMCMGNSCVNPLIYYATNKAYRERFIELLCPCYKEAVPPFENQSESITRCNVLRAKVVEGKDNMLEGQAVESVM